MEDDSTELVDSMIKALVALGLTIVISLLILSIVLGAVCVTAVVADILWEKIR